MAISLEAHPTLPQGFIKLDGVTEATITVNGITADITGNVTGNATTATTAASATRLATATGSAPSYACRAWVNFDATRDASGASNTSNTNRFIRSSGNVTSVLRTSLGGYTVTFTTPLNDSNYCTVCSAYLSGTAVSSIQPSGNGGTTSQGVLSFNGAGAGIDPTNFNVAIFGN